MLLSPRQAPGTLKNGTEHGRGHERANDAETREATSVNTRSPPSSRHSARPPIAESIITRPYHHLRTAFNGRHTISAQSRAPHGRRIQHCCVWSMCACVALGLAHRTHSPGQCMDLPAQFIAGVSSSGFISVGKHGRCSSVTSRGEVRGCVCPTSPMRCPARLASPRPRSRSSRERACRHAQSADDTLRRGAKHSVGAQERAPPYRPQPRPPLLCESARHPAPRWQCEFAHGIREWIRPPSTCHSLASAVVLVRPA